MVDGFAIFTSIYIKKLQNIYEKPTKTDQQESVVLSLGDQGAGKET
jgi:hypothetical protein